MKSGQEEDASRQAQPSQRHDTPDGYEEIVRHVQFVRTWMDQQKQKIQRREASERNQGGHGL